MRIPTLLEKIAALAAQPEQCSAIDVDLMLDYTRVLYADLLDWRRRFTAEASPQKVSVPQPFAEAPKPQPAIAIQKPTPAAQAIVPQPVVQPKPAEEAIVKPVETPAVPTPQPRVSPPVTSAPLASTIAAPPVAARDIRSMIGINDKYQIMSELFGNDKAAYEEALDFINTCPSENNAMAWLRERLWIAEERSDAAMSFFELVSRHFQR